MKEHSPRTDRIADDMIRSAGLIRQVRSHDAALRPGLEQAHIPLLDALAEGPRHITELADAQNAEPSTVSRRISRLVSLGLVEKRAADDDRRVQVAVLTDEGERAVDQMQQQRRQMVAQVLDAWDEAELEHLERMLDRLARQLAG